MTRLALLITILLSVLLGYCLLTTGHDWGDDFSGYLLQARCIVEHHPRAFLDANHFMLENCSSPPGPLAYPWGFPLLLSPVYAVWGLNLMALKSINLVCFALALFTAHALLAPRLRGPALGILLVALFAYNPILLRSMDDILSDIPFLFFSLLSLFFIDRFIVQRRVFAKPIFSYALLALSLFASAATRTNGFLLLPLLLLCQIVEALRHRPDPAAKPRRLHARFLLAASPYAIFATLFLLSNCFLPDGSHTHLAFLREMTWPGLQSRAVYYYHLPIEFLARPTLAILEQGILYGVTLPLLLIGAVRRFRHDYHLLAYLLATVALYIVWPPLQGLRFLYPILPLYLYFILQGLSLALAPPTPATPEPAAKATRTNLLTFALATILLLAFLTSTVANATANLRAHRKTSGPFDPSSTAMFAFIRDHTAPDAVIVFFKPRAMRLLTDRRAFCSERLADLSKADYLVWHKQMGDYNQFARLPASRPAPAVRLEQVFDSPEYTISHITHPAP